MPTTLPPKATICPPWCDDHDGFDDGSSDWHKTKPVRVGHVELLVSDGSLSGEPELRMSIPADTEMSLEHARVVAQAILALCDSVAGRQGTMTS